MIVLGERMKKLNLWYA